ncbi:MAG: metallophosphoesterase, partial [Phaeodactylibacter sp.]|nr:metallophosphoesterase [Phaeodactylibacter sp.]
ELEVYLAAVQYPGRRLRKVEESSSPLMAGPYLQRTAEGQWVVMMETRPGQAAPVLRWGSSHGAVDRPLEGAYHDNYWAFALPPEANACDTAYYQPVINGEAGPIAAIARRESVPFTFTAWGDSQGGWRVFREHNRQMAQSHPHFTIGLGDLVDDGVNTWQWRAMLHCLQPLASQSPVYFIPGNHDYDGYYDSLYSANYHRYSAWPNYYSWVYGNAIFLALDPNQNFPLGIDSTQEHWLETVIQSEPWRNARWRFVLLHQPPYAQGWPGYHGDGFIRQLADSLAEPAGIDFVLSGHCHDFERLTKNYGRQQTHFIVLGGAGGSLEPPESSDAPVMDKVVKDYHYGQFRVGHEKVSFQAIGLDGQLLDDITFEKRQP